jgi:hypothetical protein
MRTLKWFNLALRGVMEAGIVLALGYWGYHTGENTFSKILLCIITPLIGFGFWGLIDFHRFGKFSEPLRLMQELLICGLAALALYVVGMRLDCWFMAGVSIMHHVLVYALGERLLKS